MTLTHGTRRAVLLVLRCAAAAVCLLAPGYQACLGSEPLPETGDTAADELQERVSTRVADAAAWLDSLFGDDNYEAEANTTRLRLGVSSFSESGEGTKFKGTSSLRLKLPYLEDRLRLSVSGTSEDFDTTDSDWEDIDQDARGTDETGLGAALTYFLRQGARRNLSLSGGVRSRNGKPAAYVRPRYRQTWAGPTWDVRFIQRLTWYTDTGLDARSELQFERLLGSRWLFRTTTQVDWYDDEAGVFPQLRLSWRRPLGDRRVLALQWNNYFETSPEAGLDSTVLRVRYRQRVWRRWLWFSVAPQVAFPRERDYKGVPGLMLELEADFQRHREPRQARR